MIYSFKPIAYVGHGQVFIEFPLEKFLSFHKNLFWVQVKGLMEFECERDFTVLPRKALLVTLSEELNQEGRFRRRVIKKE